MANWRDTGCVADSDDEDVGWDGDERMVWKAERQEPTSSNLGSQDTEDGQRADAALSVSASQDLNPTPTAASREPRAGPGFNSASSSPLSSPDEDFDYGSPPPFDLSTSPRVIIPGRISMTAADQRYETDPAMFARARTFRTRTAIQLHPYLLEKEKHTRMFRAAGFRPVNIAASQELGHSQGENTFQAHQDDSELPSSPLQSSQLAPSQQPFGSSQPTESDQGILAEPLPFPDDEDELPDLETLLRQRTEGRLPKRRKLHHKTPINTSSRLAVLDNESPSMSRPPTPPTSHSGQSVPAQTDPEDEPVFRLPRAARAAVLTPKTSSPAIAPSSRRRVTVEIPAPSLREASLELSSESSTESESEPASSDNEVQFEHARKRIRGVLPASWLRFDNKTAHAKDGQRKGLAARTDSAINHTGKGVAQRRTGPNLTPRANANHLDGFSDESEEDTQATPIRRIPEQTTLDFTQSIGGTGYASDDMEDNAVDNMLPSAGRTHKQLQQPRKKQSKLRDLFRPPAYAVRSGGAQGSKDAAAPKPKKHKSRRQATPRQPALSVLDHIQEAGPSTPPFLKIARRQARQQQNYARQSPRHKSIRLATRNDTEDAMSTLTAWRAGKIRQRSLPPPSRPRSRPTSASSARTSGLRGLARQYSTAPTATLQSRIDTHVVPDHAAESGTHAGRSGGLQTTGDRSTVAKPQGRSLKVQLQARPRQVPRPAQLEAEDHRPRFERVIRRDTIGPRLLLEQAPQTLNDRQPNFQLQRFLDNLASAEALEVSDAHGEGGVEAAGADSRPSKRKLKKGRPKRLDVDTEAFRQPEVVIPKANNRATPPVEGQDTAVVGLTGLDGHYSIDFDVRPLTIGTFFHESTFLGSGDFAEVLRLKERDLDWPAGTITIQIDDQATHWSAWSEETAAWLVAIRGVCEDAFRYMAACEDATADLDGPMTTTTYLLRSLVRYVSSCLHFSDVIDWQFCIARFQSFLQELTDLIAVHMQQAAKPGDSRFKRHLADCAIFTACLWYQVVILSDLAPGAGFDRAASIQRLRHICLLAAGQLLGQGSEELRRFAEDCCYHAKRDAGARDSEVAVKFVVIANAIFKDLNEAGLSLDAIVAAHWESKLASIHDVSRLDMLWYDLLSLQPILGISASGLYKTSLSSAPKQGCWGVVKALVARTFSLYNATPISKDSQSARYLRAVLARINLVLVRWKWAHADQILPTVYDFFARRGLAHLASERPTGSPAFLQQLDQTSQEHEGRSQWLKIEDSDVAYHGFLKLLANGLKMVSLEMPQNKLRRIAFRFTPNHGRTYRKDQDVRRTDLDALRNHHDILCTLYWALPAGSRPKLTLIRDLVDYRASHLEASKISMEAWHHLALYITSDQNQQQDLSDLALWFGDYVAAMVSQYRLARSEAEEILALSKDRQIGNLSYDLVQMNVTANQSRILSSLRAALDGMQGALEVASSSQVKLSVAAKADVVAVLKLFDAEQSRTFAPVLQVLKLLKTLVQPAEAPLTQSEESQEYGDWDGVDELLDGTLADAEVVDAVTSFQPAVHQLLSNCFGADNKHSIHDNLLESLVEVWCLLAAQSVNRGARSWSAYLDDRGAQSWFALQHTERHVNYTPLMLALVLSAQGKSFDEHSEVFLTRWLVSLVDREAALKFQHRLTSAVLRAGPENALLHNLPVVTGIELTLSDIKADRIGIIGSVLSNMRRSIAASRHDAADKKREYTAMLRAVTAAMKHTYEMLGHADSSTVHVATRGPYIAFVQQIISLLQQHTTEFFSIDAFFLGSADFPLPSDDPQYIIGRLKSYVPKLSEEKTCKQLISLIQNLLDRACGEATTQALVEQLVAACSGPDRDGGHALRDLVIGSVLPGYCALVRDTEGAAFFVMPLLSFAGVMVDRVRSNIDSKDARAVQQTLDIVSAAASITADMIQSLAGGPGPRQARMALLVAAYDAGAAMLTSVEYLARCGIDDRGMDAMRRMYEAGNGDSGQSHMGNRMAQQTSGLAEYARRSLKQLLSDANWRRNRLDSLYSQLGDDLEDQAQKSMLKYCLNYETVVLGTRPAAPHDLTDLMP